MLLYAFHFNFFRFDWFVQECSLRENSDSLFSVRQTLLCYYHAPVKMPFLPLCPVGNLFFKATPTKPSLISSVCPSLLPHNLIESIVVLLVYITTLYFIQFSRSQSGISQATQITQLPYLFGPGAADIPEAYIPKTSRRSQSGK